MGIGWKVTRGVFAASNSIGKQMSNSAATSAAIRKANRGQRAVKRGFIGPWDEVPANAQDFLDYSGVATPEDLDIPPWAFPLGRYVLPKATMFGGGFPSKNEIGLSPELANRHTVVYAPAGSGKTASVIVPWIYEAMEQGYLVVALDLKGNGDLLSQVRQYAAAKKPLPDVAITNFDYTDPRESVTWNWIRDLKDDEAATEAATEALVGRKRDNDPNKEFHLRDMKWMRGLLEYASSSGHSWTVGSLLRLLDDQPRFARYITNAAPERARSRLADLVYDADYYTKVQFVSTYLEMLNTPGFNRVTSRRGLRMKNTGDEPGLLMVTAPLADGKMSEAVSGLFLSQFLTTQLHKFNTSSRPVLLVLDEAPRLQERLNLPKLMATSRSSGLSALLALQEIEDFKKDDRETILSNCVTHILLPGAGAETTGYFGKRLGSRQVSRKTQSLNYSRQSGPTFQTGVQMNEVPVLGRTEMMSPPGGSHHALVHCHELSHKPILVDLTRYDLLDG
ncbi:MAG: type IV secretion system DNA-binding domain-containing protein [Aeromicrobium sp.]|uniref:type IV secretory system conjugative DNA transfer family protein n=1 Tax=Aeromicrobium sp. TaxID=1871063 RepID=UPI0039E62BC4